MGWQLLLALVLVTACGDRDLFFEKADQGDGRPGGFAMTLPAVDHRALVGVWKMECTTQAGLSQQEHLQFQQDGTYRRRIALFRDANCTEPVDGEELMAAGRALLALTGNQLPVPEGQDWSSLFRLTDTGLEMAGTWQGGGAMPFTDLIDLQLTMDSPDGSLSVPTGMLYRITDDELFLLSGCGTRQLEERTCVPGRTGIYRRL